TRRQLIYYLKVLDHGTGQPIGRLVDITVEGMLLVSSQPIPKNTVYKLQVDLPDGLNARPPIILEARSLWSKPDINTDFIDTGFIFITIAPSDLQTITELIAEYEL
ncbi:MAG: PilZ domain-containing protein, partial [Deltaproteobacteria bacterium]|nr:PilZ domain-containing protein [Deltaproteobacteria bacterium]